MKIVLEIMGVVLTGINPFSQKPNYYTRIDNGNGRSYFLATDRHMKVCLRCNRQGHSSDTCYVKMNDQQTNRVKEVNETKQVSFLETPTSWHSRK